MFVLLKHRHALTRFQFNRQYLPGETVFLDGALCTPVTLHRQGILLLATDIVLLRQVFSRNPHMGIAHGAGQRTHHGVFHCAITHSRAEARIG